MANNALGGVLALCMMHGSSCLSRCAVLWQMQGQNTAIRTALRGHECHDPRIELETWQLDVESKVNARLSAAEQACQEKATRFLGNVTYAGYNAADRNELLQGKVQLKCMATGNAERHPTSCKLSHQV
eukprot:1234744-Amphidinium_carterae.1